MAPVAKLKALLLALLVSAPLAAPAAPGIGGEKVTVYPTASQTCGGVPCIWSDSTLGRVKMRDASGVDKLAGEADRITTAASDPGTPVFGQCYANTSIHKIRCYQNSAWSSWFDGGRQVLTSAPLTGGGPLTADLILGISLSSFFATVGGTLIVNPGSLIYAHFDGGGKGALGAGTVYLTAPGQTASATEVVLSKATRAGSLRNLYCDLGTAPGGSDTVVATVRVAGVDSLLTCTVSAAATSCSDTSDTPAVTAGQRVSIKAVSSAGTAADLTCSLEETN